MADIQWDDDKPQSPLSPPGVQWDAGAPPAAPLAGASPLAPPDKRTALGRLLLPEGAQPPRPADRTLLGLGAQALGVSPETADKVSDFSNSLQTSLAMPFMGAANVLKMAPSVGKLAGPLATIGRMGQSAGLGAAEGVSKGETGGEIGTRALTGAGASIVGDKVAQAGRYVLSAVPHKLFSGKTASELGNWLRQNVPAWAGIKGERALYDMARETGQAKLSDAYEKALTGAVKNIPAGTTINIGADVAKRVGLPVAPNLLGAPGTTAVDAQKLLTLLPSLTKDQATRRAVMDALHTGLPKGAVPDDAMREYAMGSGFMDFAKKSGLFKKGEGFDASVAQEGLRTVGKETLERRGMGGARDIIRGPLSAPPIKKESMDKPAAAVGGLLGLLGGGAGGGLLGPMGAVGGGGMGAGAGAFLGGQLGRKVPVYKNVPETIPQIGQLRRALLQALTQQVTQGVRSTGE